MELVLKTSDAAMRRGFESHPLRHLLIQQVNIFYHFDLWSNTQEVEEAPLLRA